MIHTAIILAGGFGTRLQTVVSNLPKPMAPVDGEPFLNYQLRYLKKFGITKVVLSVGYLAEKIKDYYQSSFENIEIHYTMETSPLGTGGGIRLAMDVCSEEQVLVMNGDSFFEIDLGLFSEAHTAQKAEVSIAMRKVENAARYGTIIIDPTQRVVSFREKNNRAEPGTINGGVYILNRNRFLEHTSSGISFSIESDFFEKQMERIYIHGIEFNGYFIDIGVPEDYLKAQDDFKRFKN